MVAVEVVCKKRDRDLCVLCCEGNCANFIRTGNVSF